MPPLDLTSNALAAASLAEYTRTGLLVPELCQRDTAGIISELSQALHREGCVPDMLPFYHAALNQELLCNSALPCGIAFPHARLNGVRQLRFALGRTPEPVIWGSRGTSPVQLVFLIAVPATDAARYLHLLATLARLGQNAGHLTELRTAETPDAILGILEKIRMRAGRE
jgi:mannitol/fructose-specific phosphotransferase system IIA component (Ntr-type)